MLKDTYLDAALVISTDKSRVDSFSYIPGSVFHGNVEQLLSIYLETLLCISVYICILSPQLNVFLCRSCCGSGIFVQ